MAEDGDEARRVDYLDTAAGGAAEGRGTGRRWATVIGLTIGGLAVAGGAAYGIAQFLGGGTSPAAAVPADAFGYLGMDLDPGADQQIAAYRFLEKFPAIKDHLDLGSDQDLRKEIVEAILADAPCDDLTWADDFEPWLGNSLAVAGRSGGDGPEPYVVLGVTDQAKAEDAVDRIAACGEGDGATGDDPGIAFSDDFMVVAETDAKAEQFVSDAADASLADDTRFQDRVDAVGGEGFVTGYVAPSAVDALAEGMGSFDPSLLDAAASGQVAGQAPMPGQPDSRDLKDALKDFDGAAMSLRFEDGALELRATSAGLQQTEAVSGGESGVQDLPGTTAFAVGVPVADDFVEKVLDSLGKTFGEEELDSTLDQLEARTGIDARTDLQTMLGDGIAVAVDGSADFTSLGSGGADAVRGLPVGVRIHGDPSAIEPVLQKLLSSVPVPPGFVTVEAGDDAVAVGPDPDYVAGLSGDGDLGDQQGFDAALPDFDETAPALYVDLDGAWLTSLLEADVSSEADQVRANVEPLESFGISGTVDGDEATVVMRLVTD